MSLSDKRTPAQKIIGGGTKKVLYTLNTVRDIGVKNAAKALRSNNTCKACGLGMGGQAGGMTNELGEFPSVCNKSIQAQSTDIQAPIPTEIFKHTVAELQELSGYELEHLGRLTTPLIKQKESKHLVPISWDKALTFCQKKLQETDPNRSFFYSSGRSSNEAGFLLQLFARLYGTNNVNNCSYYCHQATSEALASSIGTGTATVELEDLHHCDLVFVIGANPSSNHPRFIHKLKSIRDRGGEVVIINPAKEPGLVKFAVPKSPKSMLTGGTEIASEYMQINIGSDRAAMCGVAKALFELRKIETHFIEKYTEDFDNFATQIEGFRWEDIHRQTGLHKDRFFAIAKKYARSKNTVFAWGMGVTQHIHGVENIEAIVNLALMRGMIAKKGAGLLPLRGHSNVQGIGTIGVKPVLSQDVFRSIEKHFNVKLPDHPGLDTLACLKDAKQNKIDLALMMGGNLYHATPNSAFAASALDAIGCKIYLTTTLNSGHIHGIENSETIIFPVCARDEEWQATTQESMFNFVRLSDGGIKRHDNVWPEVEILSTLASITLQNCPIDFDTFKKHQTIRQAIANIVPGMEELGDIDIAKREFHIKNRILHTPIFNTPSKKASFQAISIGKKTRGASDYPFTLSTIRSEGQFNTIVYEEKDSYRNTDTRWSVLMSPDDMRNLRVQNRDRITIESPWGSMKAVMVFPFDLPTGNIMAYFPEANLLLGLDHDQRSKTPSFKAVNVRVNHV